MSESSQPFRGISRNLSLSDKVVEQFPKNEKTIDAAYWKAYSLQKGGHHADAKEEYKSFLSKYPTSEHAAQARRNLNSLEPPTPKPGGSSGQAASGSSALTAGNI